MESANDKRRERQGHHVVHLDEKPRETISGPRRWCDGKSGETESFQTGLVTQMDNEVQDKGIAGIGESNCSAPVLIIRS